jgi:hypothetical protein
MLTTKEKELFDTKISLVNNKAFREMLITQHLVDAVDCDVIFVALWNTPVLYYDVKKRYPTKEVYYVEFEALRDIYGVENEAAIYINDEKDLANIMKKFKNPKLLINPPYSIGGKIVAKCKEAFPAAKYSILMPIAQYKTAAVTEETGQKHKLFEYIDNITVIGGGGFDATITENNCIITLNTEPNTAVTYDDYILKTINQRYIAYYLWNIEHNIGLTFKPCSYSKPEDHDIETEFLEISRASSASSGAGFGKKGWAYLYNVPRAGYEEVWGADIAAVKLPSSQAKQNFSTWWYYGKKRERLASKVLLGTNNVHMSGTSYYAIPQIDWTTLHINQKVLWDQGLYDNAVLAEMGLKWDGDTIVKETN